MSSQTALLWAQDSIETTTTETVEEEEKSPIEFGGSVDGYYRANLSGDYDGAPGTSFANLPGFSLGMVNLTAGKEGKKAGFMADLVFGPRGEDATFLSPFLRPGGSSSIVNQLYVYWNISDKFTATIGNFNTFLGYEVISPTANFNYSTSYMFSYGPFSHTGLKFDVDLGKGFSLMAGVFNPTDATEFNPDNTYVGGAQLGYDFGKGSVYLNGLFQDGFYQLDITGGVDVTDNVFVGLNATTASDSFSGAALYVQAQATDALKLGIRGEYFADQGIEVVGIDESVIDLTLSANYTIGNLTLIPEFRIDLASQSIFADDLEMNETLPSFILAAVYGF